MRLSAATLHRLPPDVARPRYDRAAVATGIVHLGIGAFQRAHQAMYTEAALNAGDTRWGIVGASLRSPAVRDALTPQDGLYTLSVRGAEGERLQVIGAIRDVLVAPEDPEALLRALCDPSLAIVTLTVTEKGYCYDPATAALDETHPDIVHDLANPARPRTAPGFLVEALRRRRAAQTHAFTVLCCDNLPHNGRAVRAIVTHFAARGDSALAGYIANEVAFPSTMVDRITPATTDDDRAAIAKHLGVEDAAPVVTEPFSQWVIEDRFPLGRPDWSLAGAEFVTDVAPYENMKLRLLNGSHSTLAYLGYLAGYETVSDTMKDANYRRLAEGVMDDAATTLRMPPGADVAAYKRALMERYANPALKHRTWQICMDGSQKLPQRLLGSIRDRLAAGAPIDRLVMGVAGWMRYVTGVDEQGKPIDVRDPLSVRLRAIADEAGPVAERLAPALLDVREIFAPALAADARFRTGVTGALARIIATGAKQAVAKS
ncbi:MAG: mannitol dehydrogenase family protein [Alphaproteobacteria bacterium]|nr:MAG: mannitol dehydrogenase family protein [Alphaproteobacteria bacterium]